MGYVGLSLIFATAVLVLVSPPPWLRRQFLLLFHSAPSSGPASPAAADATVRRIAKAASEKPTLPDDHGEDNEEKQCTDSGDATPKAEPVSAPGAVPVFSLDQASDAAASAGAPTEITMPAPTAPSSLRPPAHGSMPPPPRPPRLAPFPSLHSPQRASGPAPQRGPSLAPPPTHSAIPTKPSRKVMLTPGHSPLDWARISGPSADLRGLPPASPFLKVTPSMLRNMTGRRGKDAWMAIGGKVYNIGPYAEFHPGGVPELMRGAARDATQLFGEVHPWVNYENMLQACLVGILVDEEDPAPAASMESMD
ncbi:hypothetical protein TD95_000435 [Thielaviopsis punctulata]|uniref:Cytochrome b5 heme-binding domain-containing protein n=1 Tax=Thielaviopsis punctulata TaxID=72032 RepID=A0A0F4ZIY7_9PEZI|nr:hypothetical protein TD95_000435 [Thielaviopsis punctulata]